MPTYCSAVGAADAAVPLAAVARDVYHDVVARVTRDFAGVASVKAVHSPRCQVECGADADDGLQHMRQGLVLVSIVEVPAFIMVVG